MSPHWRTGAYFFQYTARFQTMFSSYKEHCPSPDSEAKKEQIYGGHQLDTNLRSPLKEPPVDANHRDNPFPS